MPLSKWIGCVLCCAALNSWSQGPAPDSVFTVANAELYQPRSVLRRILMGDNYRDAWQQEVRVPVFKLTASGFKVSDLGGGMQTKSLRLVDAQGRHWALRTVNKQITDGGLSPALRNPTGRKFSQDFISAGHPFAAPLAGAVASAAGVIAARPQAFYVADDTAFGDYRSYFSGQLCTLEERDAGFDSTAGSDEMAAALQRDNHYKVQPAVYLKARLLDMLLADWDRHAGNWRWGLKDSAGFHFYYAVPRDRDWAFYQSSGVLPWLAKATGAMRYLTGFTNNVGNLKQLNWKAWTLDKFFAGELGAADWERITQELETALSDAAIEKAVQVLPAAIYEKEGAGFVQTLKSRRDGLRKAVMKYYRFLAEEIVVNGSDEAETFLLSADGEALVLRVFRDSDSTQVIYQRRLLQSETFSLVLNGFDGDDVFEVAGNVQSKMRLRINGGEGVNHYNVQGRLRTRISSDGGPTLLTTTGRLAAKQPNHFATAVHSR